MACRQMDGKQELRYDGRKVYSSHNCKYRYFSRHTIQRFMFHVYHGGKWDDRRFQAQKDQAIWCAAHPSPTAAMPCFCGGRYDVDFLCAFISLMCFFSDFRFQNFCGGCYDVSGILPRYCSGALLVTTHTCAS